MFKRPFAAVTLCVNLAAAAGFLSTACGDPAVGGRNVDIFDVAEQGDGASDVAPDLSSADAAGGDGAGVDDVRESADAADVRLSDAADVTSDAGDAVLEDVGADVAVDVDAVDAADEGSGVTDVVDELVPAPVPVALRLEPPSISLEAELGVPSTQHFDAVVTLSDGTETPWVDGIVWSSSDPYRVRASGTGDISLIADRDGSFELRARLDDLHAVATIDLSVHATYVLDGIDPTIGSSFDTATPDTSGLTVPTWLYPADRTMFPIGIVPPLLQWRAGSGVIHHVTVQRGGFTADIYTTSSRWSVPAEIWRALDFEHGTPVVLSLESLTALDGGTLLDGGSRTIFTADADLAGDVYYWQVATGDIMRIPEGATSPLAVFSTNSSSGNCRGCHTITPDGGRLGFMYNGGDNPRAGLAWTDAPEPSIIANGSALRWDMLSFNPSGRRALAVLFGSTWLADTTPGVAGGAVSLGNVAAINAGAPVTHPAWSRDGSRVAYVRRGGNADWEFYSGDIYQVSWDPRTEAFGTPQLFIARGSTSSTDTLSYPTWSPDSRYIAYTQGPDNRGTSPSTLWMADALTGERVQLVNAGPGGQDVYTSFSPYLSGGYYWLLFYSQRPYGDITTEKQLWVAAIDADAGIGSDPSFSAFWLPGQDPGHDNITGVWAPPPCPSLGGDCKDSADCCSGYECLSDADGNYTCQESTCSLPGAPCAASDTCCPGHTCAPDLNGVDVCVPDP